MNIFFESLKDSFLGSTIDYLLVIFLFLLIFVIWFLLKLKGDRLKREDQEKLAQYSIYGFFSSILFEETPDENQFNKKIEKLKKKVPYQKTWCKELIIENIIDLDKNLKGGQKDILIKTYLKLGLYTYMNSLLKTGKGYYISKALYFWRELGYEPSAKAIYPFVKHKNVQIRTSALLAYISISDEDPLKVLEEYIDFISPIDEIKLLDIIQRKKIKKPDQLGEWLDFNIPSHVGFVLKLVAYYNALEFIDKVIELLGHENENVRKSALDTVRKLLISDAEQKLIEMYPYENEVFQYKIISVLGQIGAQKSIEFLRELVRQPFRSEILIQAMYSLKEIDKSFNNDSFNNDPKLNALKSHVLDPNL